METEQGARTIVRLARQYGASIIRNALALATAMSIEDGEPGL
jgi:spore coat protein CotH